MKNGMKLLFLFTFIFTLFLAAEPVKSHPGNTDRNGGHTCKTNCESWNLSYGEYHYHGGDGRGFNYDAYFRERCENAIIADPTLIKVPDNCLSDYGMSVKQKSLEESKRKFEEERLFRQKKQRENNISNWIVFLSLLLSLFLYKRNSDYYKLFVSKMAKSGSWVFFIGVYYLNKKYPITFDWNGVEKLRIIFVSFSSIFIFKFLEDNFDLSSKLINLRTNFLKALKISYQLLINLLQKLKIFDLINLVFKILSFLIERLSRFLIIFRKPLIFILSVAIVFWTLLFPAVFYGIFGIIIFSTSYLILKNLFSFNFELVASFIFNPADVDGLNEIATFLFSFVGFVIGFIFYFIKNRKKIKDELLAEYLNDVN